jgi:type IV pilus assembly protein PilY1
LSDPSYNGNHRFFVDGSPWVGDACLKIPASDCAFSSLSSTDWRTVLVGTTGAGGRGVFALDVTDPENFGPSKVLWDLAGQTDSDLGFTVGQPVIGRLNDGNYYAIFGNGYLSPNNCAVLYLVRLADGNVRRISASAGNLGSGNSASVCTNANGLGRPSLFDANGNRTTEAIYAADMLGNLWKFDVSDSDPSDWRVATGNNTPLFTARNKCGGVQPITGLIEIGAPPSGQTGAMIYFGTGRFLSADDRVDTTRQSFYGILDRNSSSRLNNPGAAVSTDTTCAAPPTTDSNSDLSNRNNLQEQILSGFGSGKRTITSTATVNYAASGNTAKNLGWYVDLAVTDPVSGGTDADSKLGCLCRWWIQHRAGARSLQWRQDVQEHLHRQ